MMDTRRNGLILLALLLLTRTTIHAQTDSMGKDLPVDSVSIVTSDSLQAKRSFFKKFLDYFNDANKEKKNKKFEKKFSKTLDKYFFTQVRDQYKICFRINDQI